jgi:hypothetical protein
MGGSLWNWSSRGGVNFDGFSVSPASEGVVPSSIIHLSNYHRSIAELKYYIGNLMTVGSLNKEIVEKLSPETLDEAV